jgi:hypothetical protein
MQGILGVTPDGTSPSNHPYLIRGK